MWANDLLIIGGICHPGDAIRQYRCFQPTHSLKDSNAVLVQLQGRDNFGKLQSISLIRRYRVDITGDRAYLNILDPSGALKSHELTVLKAWLKQHHKRAFADAATQALLASHEA